MELNNNAPTGENNAQAPLTADSQATPAPTADSAAQATPTPETAAPGNLRAGAVIPPAPDEDQVVLKDGRIARIIVGKGHLIRQARRIADGDSSMMQSALVSLCTTINGAPITVEDLDAMDLADALDIEAAWNVKNG